MLNRIALMMGLVVLTTVSNASAAIVYFKGVITGPNTINSGGIVLPSGDFTVQLNVNPSLLGGSIVGGQYTFGVGGSSPVTLAVTAGNVITGNGSILFSPVSPVPSSLSPTSAIGSTFQFLIPGMTSGALTPAKFALLVAPPTYTSGWVLNHNSSSGSILAEYTGSISTVPEPGSVIALSGLALGAAGWRLRKRRLSTLN